MSRVVNVHERRLASTPEAVGRLLDTLASADDRLWPGKRWWPQRFDDGLVVGAKGGHGPIRYRVEAYEPGRSVAYRFPPKSGFDGTHRFDVVAQDGATVLRHTLEMETTGRATLLWRFWIRPLHDALVEDALENAERELTGRVERPARHSAYVRFLRRFWLRLE